VPRRYAWFPIQFGEHFALQMRIFRHGFVL
jgi:hypothetical protein